MIFVSLVLPTTGVSLEYKCMNIVVLYEDEQQLLRRQNSDDKNNNSI
jgi:hypothetical protein